MLRIHLELAKVFFRLGVLLIGGGYAMLPLLRREVVEKRGWLCDEELLNYYAVGQATPGIIAVNTATFIGYRRAGIAGALLATVALLIPAIVSIIIIAACLQEFRDLRLVQSALQGMRVAVAALLTGTVFRLSKTTLHRPLEWMLAVFALIAVAGFRLSPIPVILAACVVGILAGPVLDVKG